MTLESICWEDIQTFLFSELKLSTKPGAVSATKSNFRFLKEFFDDKDWTRENFNIFMDKLRKLGYKPNYMNNFIKVGNYIDKYLGMNELVRYTYFKANKTWYGEPLEPDEIKQLAEVTIPYRWHRKFINKRNEALILLLGTTGCRISEALDLQPKHLLTMPYRVLFTDTKNNEDRTNPISKDLYDQLKSLSRSKYIFVSATQRHLLNTEVNLDLKRRAKAAGINKTVYCHLFRHSFITTMLDAGVDSMDVAILVGHKDPRTTLRYRHSSANHFAEVMLNHPLRKSEMTWEHRVNKLRDFATKMGGNITINENRTLKELSITLSG